MNFGVSLAAVTGLVSATGLSILLVPGAIWCGKRLGLLDYPDGQRRIHKTAIPRTGGMAVFVSVAIASLIALAVGGFPQTDDISVGIAVSIALVLAVGVIDDWRGIRPVGKIAVQAAAAYVAIHYGVRIERISLTADIGFSTGIFAVPVTLLWLIAVTNAVNLVDGLDGLASSIGLVACLALASVDVYLGGGRSAIVAFAMAGGLLGFVRYNRPPAKVFLGDAGSMSLGFGLGLLSITAATDARSNTYILAPLFALAYPLVDTLIAIARRWLRGHPLSRADGRHVHHRLLAMQLTAEKAVGLLTIVFSFVAMAGVLVAFAPPQLTLALFVATMVFFFVASVSAVRWLQYTEFVELGAACWSVLINGRSVLREKIRAGDLAEQIAAAETFDQLQSVIDEAGGDLHVLSMELLFNETRGRSRHLLRLSSGTPPCRLDYHLRDGDGDRHGEFLLRIWSSRDGRSMSGHPSAERIAARIGPAVEKWMRAHPETARQLDRAQRLEVVTEPSATASQGLLALASPAGRDLHRNERREERGAVSAGNA